MAIPALVSTPGAADANTFASLAEYKTYIVSRRPAVKWATQADAGLIDTDLTIDLLSSCEILNAGLIWSNKPATDTQALIMPGLNWRDRFDRVIPNDVVHIDMKRAQCELAVQLHEDAITNAEANDILADDDAAKFNVRGVKAGSVAVEFEPTKSDLGSVATKFRSQQSQFNYLTVIPRAVRLLLVPSWYVESDMQFGLIFEPL